MSGGPPARPATCPTEDFEVREGQPHFEAQSLWARMALLHCHSDALARKGDHACALTRFAVIKRRCARLG